VGMLHPTVAKALHCVSGIVVQHENTKMQAEACQELFWLELQTGGSREGGQPGGRRAAHTAAEPECQQRGVASQQLVELSVRTCTGFSTVHFRQEVPQQHIRQEALWAPLRVGSAQLLPDGGYVDCISTSEGSQPWRASSHGIVGKCGR
jgi:hypothetical protein